ncbi:MAG TPA: hypothetical protein VFC23_14380 [Thermoanaerobaculia bacterium]|nr:hypothetical protein [Thermoanaerobaculia bacterium]
MSKLSILGSGCLLLLCVGIFAAIHFGAACLFVPCDRSVEFVLQPPNESLDGCELWLFHPSDKTLSHPWHRLPIEDHKAEVIVQPWNESFLIALHCKGSRLSDPQLVDAEHKETVSLFFQRPRS